jgi:ATP-dependent protease HslVU (ClpYQ) peptidase subunit
MTAIVGLVHDSKVYIGGDSAGVSGFSINIRRDPKVFRNGPYVLGFTSSFRMGQLLHHAFVPPEPSGDLDKFMVTTWVDALRDCLKTGGWATKENEQESGGTFLVGINGRLFEVASDYQVGEPADGFAAIGCGYDLALGAMYATIGQAPKRRIRTALEAAERYSAGVQGPFTIVSTKAGS